MDSAENAITIEPLRPGHFHPFGSVPDSARVTASSWPETSPIHALQCQSYAETPQYHESNSVLASYIARRGARGFVASLLVDLASDEEAERHRHLVLDEETLPDGARRHRLAVGYIIGYPLDPDAELPELHKPRPQPAGVPAAIDAVGFERDDDHSARLEWATFSTYNSTALDGNGTDSALLPYYLADRVVHPDFQQRGIGSLLLDALIGDINGINAAFRERGENIRIPRLWALSVNAVQVPNLSKVYSFRAPLNDYLDEKEDGADGDELRDVELRHGYAVAAKAGKSDELLFMVRPMDI